MSLFVLFSQTDLSQEERAERNCRLSLEKTACATHFCFIVFVSKCQQDPRGELENFNFVDVHNGVCTAVFLCKASNRESPAVRRFLHSTLVRSEREGSAWPLVEWQASTGSKFSLASSFTAVLDRPAVTSRGCRLRKTKDRGILPQSSPRPVVNWLGVVSRAAEDGVCGVSRFFLRSFSSREEEEKNKGFKDTHVLDKRRMYTRTVTVSRWSSGRLLLLYELFLATNAYPSP